LLNELDYGGAKCYSLMGLKDLEGTVNTADVKSKKSLISRHTSQAMLLDILEYKFIRMLI
jgi:hypothetical protein